VIEKEAWIGKLKPPLPAYSSLIAKKEMSSVGAEGVVLYMVFETTSFYRK